MFNALDAVVCGIVSKVQSKLDAAECHGKPTVQQFNSR